MTELSPIVKRIEVGCPPQRAFDVFTGSIHEWWPLEGHSLGEGKVERVVFEPGVGGRILERWFDGTECTWGEVSVWEPPRRVAFSWLPDPRAGAETEVEVTFEPNGASTVVTLEHRGWDPASRDADERYRNYDTGWARLLGLFRERATSTAV